MAASEARMALDGKTYRYRGVACLHCKKPVPLFAEPEGAESPAGPALLPGVMLVWCQTCRKEYPYSTGDIMHYDGPPPPKNFKIHPVFARSRTPREASKAAGSGG
jgi:hypothetical protein